MALELVGDRIRETDVKLTPAHGGRFEIYVNGEKVYDRKIEGTPDFVPFHRAIGPVQDSLRNALGAAPAGSAH